MALGHCLMCSQPANLVHKLQVKTGRSGSNTQRAQQRGRGGGWGCQVPGRICIPPDCSRHSFPPGFGIWGKAWCWYSTSLLSHCHHCICAATASTYKVPHGLLTSGTACVEQAQCKTCALHTIDLKATHKADTQPRAQAVKPQGWKQGAGCI